MADLSSIGNLRSAEPLDLSMYKDARPFELPKAGVYTLRAPDAFSASAFSATKANDLLVTFTATIVGPTNEGFEVRRTRVSAKEFESDGQKQSMIGRYLRSCGVTDRISGDPQELADAVERTAGQSFDAYLDWEGSHYASGFEVKGMKNFPSDGNGGKQTWAPHPTERDENGDPLRVKAYLVVKRFIAGT